MTLVSSVLGQKRLEMVRDISPKATKFAVLVNPISPDTAIEVESIEVGAKALGVQVEVFNASTPAEIDAAFDAIASRETQALLVGTDPFFLNQRAQITARANRLGVPAIYPFRDYVLDGGLISYGTDIANSYYQAGVYAGRILKGEKVADLPVMRPTKFALMINAKSAEAMAIKIPPYCSPAPMRYSSDGFRPRYYFLRRSNESTPAIGHRLPRPSLRLKGPHCIQSGNLRRSVRRQPPAKVGSPLMASTR
jgi:putative ABC transport system substrate-binding protein